MNKSRISNFTTYLFMHIGFIIYSFYAVLGKYVSKTQFLSLKFFALVFSILVLLFLYAFIWQQILKRIPLFLAIANKTITIIWGMFWGKLLFSESITIKMIIGTVIIIFGLVIISTGKENPQAK